MRGEDGIPKIQKKKTQKTPKERRETCAMNRTWQKRQEETGGQIITADRAAEENTRILKPERNKNNQTGINLDPEKGENEGEDRANSKNRKLTGQAVLIVQGGCHG